MNKWGKLILSIGGCFAIAFLGSLVTTPSINSWYQTLSKPSFNPPNWVFGPVWTILYLLMGISLYLVWNQKPSKKTKSAISLFALQLFLNFLWSFLFFYLHQPLIAFGEIILLWLVIFLTIIKFNQISKIAARLLIPYLLWVSFASILNLSIALLN